MNGPNNNKSTGLDLTPYSSATDLEKAIDGDTLKGELSRLGLKCGGTVTDRAKRLFLTKDTPLDQLPKKLFAKGSASNKSHENGGEKSHISLCGEIDTSHVDTILALVSNTSIAIPASGSAGGIDSFH